MNEISWGTLVLFIFLIILVIGMGFSLLAAWIVQMHRLGK